MKRIKLRAWHISEQKMCKVETLTDAGAFLVGVKKGEDDYGRKYFVRAPEHGRFCENDEFELMQFTGLHDKNGKNIYSDDIIEDTERGIRHRVYSMYGGFAIKAPHWASLMGDMVMGDDLIMQPLADGQTMSYIAQAYTIIGNIYESPELL